MIDGNGRVGGRPGNHSPPPGGGGYSDICNILRAVESRFSKKKPEKITIKIEDLREMGLSGKWLEIAERVGVETWIEIWEILDRENINQPSSLRDALRIRVPMYSKLIKYLRNRHIARLTRCGFGAAEIHKILKLTTIEQISITQIIKIQNKMKALDHE